MLYFCFFSGLSPQNFKVDFCFLDVEETKEFVRNFHKIIPVFIWCKYQCLQQKSPRIPDARDFFSPSLRSSVAGEAAYNLRLQLTCGKAGSSKFPKFIWLEGKWRLIILLVAVGLNIFFGAPSWNFWKVLKNSKIEGVFFFLPSSSERKTTVIQYFWKVVASNSQMAMFFIVWFFENKKRWHQLRIQPSTARTSSAESGLRMRIISTSQGKVVVEPCM